MRLTEALHASEEAFRLAFEGAGIGMTMLSLDPADAGRYLRVNDAMCAITGSTPDQLMPEPSSTSPIPTTWRSTPPRSPGRLHHVRVPGTCAGQ